MTAKIIIGTVIPFAGTILGAATVFFLKKQISDGLHKILLGFAAGVMMAASFWSLLEPAIEESSVAEGWSFLPAVVGFAIGIVFMLLHDVITPHMHIQSETEEAHHEHKHNHGHAHGHSHTSELMLAVMLHNIPEGMALGVICAGWMSGSAGISSAGALALAIGIAIHNFPVGVIVSMPLRAKGMKKRKAFLYGVIAGVVQPIATLITLLAANSIVTVLPYLQAFAAGAMIYVVVGELIPEMSGGKHSNTGTISFSVGFMIMMLLEIVLE